MIAQWGQYVLKDIELINPEGFLFKVDHVRMIRVKVTLEYHFDSS